MLTYSEALDVLQAAERFGIHPSLGSIRALAEALGRPQDAYASIQVTGTNGKSSTTRMIAALLEAHGLRAGAYTSPELESMTERIEVSGAPVSEGDFARAIAAASAGHTGAVDSGTLPAEEVRTQFELLTGAALWLFRAKQVDVACLEVGMGGRWDATSVVSPAVAVITGVGVDHVEQLGATREAIAEDKSHVIKHGAVAVLGPGTSGVEEIFLQRAESVGAQVIAVRAVGQVSPTSEERTVRFELRSRPSDPGGRTVLNLRGLHGEYDDLSLAAPAYQAPNLACAIAAVEAFRERALDGEALQRALSAMTFPGRFERVLLDPLVVIDAAHNPQAAGVLAEAIRDAWPARASDAAPRHPRRQGRARDRRRARAGVLVDRRHREPVAAGIGGRNAGGHRGGRDRRSSPHVLVRRRCPGEPDRRGGRGPCRDGKHHDRG